MSIDGNIRARRTRCLCKHHRIKAYVKKVSVRKEDPGSRNLDHRFIIDTIHEKVTVAEYTCNTFTRHRLKRIRIRGKVPRVQPQFCLRCAGNGKHFLKDTCISMTVADNSDSHTTPLSISNCFIMSSAAPR